jgi:hypothetical protein
MVHPDSNKKFCSTTHGNGMGFNTEASSLFEAAANAIRRAEVTRKHFRTNRMPQGR